MSWCGCICDVADDVVDFVEDTVEDAVDWVEDAVEDAIESVGDFFEDVGEWVSETIEDIGEFISEVATKVWDWITETADSIWEWIKKTAGDVWEWTTGALEDAWDWVKETASDAWDWIKDTAESVWNTIVHVAEKIGEFIEEKVIPFLEDVLWALVHLDEFILSGILGFLCLILEQDEREYDIIEGMYSLDEDLLSRRKVAFQPITGKYAIFSDLHLFVAGDQLDKFRQLGNHELYQAVLLFYHLAGYTLIENGDIEDLWMREENLSDAILEDTFDILGFPFGDAIEEDYEDHRIRSQAVKIFENNADVYQVIRNLFYDNQRFLRIIGNHDDIWHHSDYLEGLQVIYPGIEVHDYVFLGSYTDSQNHGGNSPQIIIAHGHQLDAWNTYACREAGAGMTESASGYPSAATSVTKRSKWENKLNGQGFDNELSESIFSIDEVEFYDYIMDDFSNQPYIPKFILGHTHRALKDPLLPGYSYHPTLEWTGIGRFGEYINDGTAGRWEQFIWCVTVDNWKINLCGWTWGDNGRPLMIKFEGAHSDYLEAVSFTSV